jgi:hypothetical protein
LHRLAEVDPAFVEPQQEGGVVVREAVAEPGLEFTNILLGDRTGCP